MTTRTFFILVVCLLQAQQAFAFNHTIDLKRCREKAKDTICYVRDSCLSEKKDDDGNDVAVVDTKLTSYANKSTEKFKDGTCDVIVQIKPFTKNVVHIMIQVTTPLDKPLKPELGMKFEQNDLLFECKTGDPTSEWKLNATVLGGQVYTQSLMFCSLLLEPKPAGMLYTTFDDPKYFNKFPTLSFEADKTVSLASDKDGATFWEFMVYCDPSQVTSLDSKTSGKYKFIQETDWTLPVVTCSKDLLVIQYKSGSDEFELSPKEFYCKTRQYSYRTKEEPPNEVVIPAGTQINVFCAEEFCKSCDAFKENTCDDGGCVPAMGPPGECMILSCPIGKKWRMENGGLSDTASTVDCKRSKKDGQKAAWFMGEDEITGGSCSATFDCQKYANFKFACPPDVTGCSKASESEGNVISCDDGFDLKFGDKTAANLTCKASDGIYSSAEGVAADRESQIYCLQQTPPPAAEQAPMSAGQTTAIVVGVSLVIAALAAVIVFLVCWRKRREAPKTQVSSMPTSDDPNMKTGVAYNSKEGMEGKGAGGGGTKSQTGLSSASEAPPSTDRPSKEKSMPESSDVKEKTEPKKEEISEDKKEEKGERKEVKKEKKKPARITMDMSKRQVPNLRQVNREMEQMKGREPADLKPNGKRVDASDITPSQLRFAENPDDKLKLWDETVFQEMLLPAVTILKPDHRTTFLRNLVAFEHHRPGGQLECGTLGQFFQVVRRCQEKGLDCPPTWEMINRLVKLLCAHLPPKDPVVERMRKMMREIGHMLIKDIGFSSNPQKDNSDDLVKRELACRILLGAEDPVCLEELKRQGHPKPDDIDAIPLQTVLYSHALNRMGKKEQIENFFYEELKKGAKENPKPKDRPFGTARQHLIYALCSDENPEGMAAALEQIADSKSRKDVSKPAGEFNPTELLYAYRGATEHPLNIDKVANIFEAKTDPSFEDAFNSWIDEFAKSQEAKAELRKQLTQDVLEMCHVLAENCVSKEQFNKLNRDSFSVYIYAVVKPGSNQFDASKLQARASNLETLLKDKKKCAELIEDALKKADY